MDDLSFNNSDKDSLFFLKSFFRDFKTYKHIRMREEEKTTNQKQFEIYLKTRGIVVVDYTRVIQEPKYFETLSLYLIKTAKKTLIWNSLQLAYISPSHTFHSYNIPQKPQQHELKNIYEYLFMPPNDPKRFCVICADPHAFYFCSNCSSYFCKDCLYKRIKVLNRRHDELYYFSCSRCDKFHIIYKLPH